MTIEQLSNEVAANNKKSGSQQIFIDPVTITIICSILSVLFAAIRTWITYRKAKSEKEKELNGTEVINLVSGRSVLLNWRTRSIVKKHLGKKRYKAEGKQLANIILDTIENSSPRDIGKMLDEENEKSNGWVKI